MRRNPIILKLLGTVLLAVFAFSVTPKILLHDLVADHKDSPRSHNNSKEQQFSKKGFNCNCDNLVVESPFLIDYTEIDITTTQNFSELRNTYINHFGSVNYFYLELRGPPSFMLTDLSLI